MQFFKTDKWVENFDNFMRTVKRKVSGFFFFLYE